MTPLKIPVFIYGLYDTKDRIIRYIGQSEQIEVRLGRHLTDGNQTPVEDRTYKERWIFKRLREGYEIRHTCFDISTISQEEADQKEIMWIAFFRALSGDRLTNGSIGGQGVRGRSQESKGKISRKQKKFWEDPKRREEKSQSEKERWSDETLRQQRSEEKKAFYQTPEGKIAIEARKKKLKKKGWTPPQQSLDNLRIGWEREHGPLSEEHKEKISRAHSGKELSEEHKRNIGKAFLGRKYGPMSDEHREKISKGKQTTKQSTRIKMSIAAKKRKYRQSPYTSFEGFVLEIATLYSQLQEVA